MAAESWSLRWLASREALHTCTWMLSLGSVFLEAFLPQSVRWLHIASHSFSPWKSGFSEMDAQGKLEEEPVNLPGEMKLKVRCEFLTRV